jgi:hypothetical protein
VAVFTANPIPFTSEFGRKVDRPVLVNATDLEWHRALTSARRELKQVRKAKTPPKWACPI